MARLPSALRGKPLDWGDDEAATRVQGDAASLSLIAREGPIGGHVFGSDGQAITIGRGSSCGVHLALSEISRQHATIRYHAGRYWVEDLQTLNGTRVNQQLIDRPTALNQGDRIRVGAQEFEVRFDMPANRQVVWDGPHSDAVVSVSPAQQASRGTVRPPLGPFGIAAVVLLAISSGVLLAFAVTRQSRRATVAPPRAQLSPAAATMPSGASAQTAPSPAPVRARVEVDGDVALAVTPAGRVQWSAARGTPVRSGDDLVRLRLSNAAKQRELERINEELEDHDSNPELISRAHAVADELMSAPTTATIKSDFDGVVLAAPAVGARVQPGTEAHVARRIRLVVDASAIVGAGSACRVSFLDQHLEADGRRVVGDVGATIELTRFPEDLSFEALGRVRADCK